MHIPADYEIKDSAVIAAFIQKHPFAQMVCASDDFPLINHLPFIYDPVKQCLWGHLAKKNPDFKYLNESPVTVVFIGPQGYISPDWYEKSGVPTWNYQTVHIKGICHRFSDESIVQKVVDDLSALHQKSLGLNWVNDYNPAMLSAIEAIKIDIKDMHCQFKLSQDRSVQDQQNVIKALAQIGQTELANAMRHQL